MAKVAWIGLGVMGYPMAGHLAKKGGHDLTVYNRNGAKAEAWVKEHGGGKTALTPADAAKDQDFVFCCVGNDNDLREVTLGPKGAFNGMKKGAIFIDNTTASANIARELYAAAKGKGFDFLDAPVSGGQAGAVNGVLTVMIGGDQGPYDRAKPVIVTFARMATLIGPSGAGQLTKMVNQAIVAVTVQGVSEGLRAGLDAGTTLRRSHGRSIRSTASSAIAMASISIIASLENSELTSTIVSAGYGAAKYRPRSSTTSSKCPMSVRKIVTLNTLRRLDPPLRSARSRFSNARRAWAAKSPGATTRPSAPTAA